MECKYSQNHSTKAKNILQVTVNASAQVLHASCWLLVVCPRHPLLGYSALIQHYQRQYLCRLVLAGPVDLSKLRPYCTDQCAMYCQICCCLQHYEGFAAEYTSPLSADTSTAYEVEMCSSCTGRQPYHLRRQSPVGKSPRDAFRWKERSHSRQLASSPCSLERVPSLIHHLTSRACSLAVPVRDLGCSTRRA